MLPSLIIIDDFLDDPVEARRQALRLDYDPLAKDGNYPGITSTRPLSIPGLDAAVSRVVGTPLAAAPSTLHAHCRLTLKADRGLSGVHVDPVDYSGILFLSAAEDCRGGTDFYRHRRTGLDRVPATLAGAQGAGYDSLDALIGDVVNADTLRPSKWERSMTAPMRFNRLILFSPWLFHNSGSGFGDRAANGRLVYLMFFAAVGTAPA